MLLTIIIIWTLESRVAATTPHQLGRAWGRVGDAPSLLPPSLSLSEVVVSFVSELCAAATELGPMEFSSLRSFFAVVTGMGFCRMGGLTLRAWRGLPSYHPSIHSSMYSVIRTFVNVYILPYVRPSILGISWEYFTNVTTYWSQNWNT